MVSTSTLFWKKTVRTGGLHGFYGRILGQPQAPSFPSARATVLILRSTAALPTLQKGFIQLQTDICLSSRCLTSVIVKELVFWLQSLTKLKFCYGYFWIWLNISLFDYFATGNTRNDTSWMSSLSGIFFGLFVFGHEQSYLWAGATACLLYFHHSPFCFICCRPIPLLGVKLLPHRNIWNISHTKPIPSTIWIKNPQDPTSCNLDEQLQKTCSYSEKNPRQNFCLLSSVV